MRFAPMRSYLFPLLLAIPVSIFSQSQQIKPLQIDPRLFSVYEKEYLERVVIEDPFLIKRWNFYLDNAFFISDSPLNKNGNAESYPSVSIPDIDHINILQLESEQNLKHEFYAETVYKIEGTKKYLIYLAGKDFVDKLNLFLNRKSE